MRIPTGGRAGRGTYLLAGVVILVVIVLIATGHLHPSK